jgi:hypothetical protein
MTRQLKRRIMAALVAVGLSASTVLAIAGPASATSSDPAGGVSVVSPPPPNVCLYGDCAQQTFCSDGTCVPGPPPACSSGYCIPQTPVSAFGAWIPQSWYVATSVITNEGLFRIGNPVVGDNPTTVDNPTCISLAQTVTGSATASLQGTFGIDQADVAGAVAEIQPGVSASVGYSYTFSGSAPCPAETNTTIYFGIGYVQTTGTVYSLSASGQITSQSGVVATAPTGWAYYTQYTPAVYGP